MRLLTRGSSAVVAATLALGGVALLPTAAHAAPHIHDQPITLESGHIDAFTPVLNDDGSLQLAIKEDVTPPGGVLRTPESVEFFVKSEALIDFPDGYVPGLPSSGYHLPLTQNHKLIWPGWDTQHITSEYPGANTDFVVSEIDGPGKVFLWTQAGFGEVKSLLKDGGYQLPGAISQPYPGHTHAAWTFTEPGTYKFSVRADVTANEGKQASSQNATYTFVVAERSKLTPQAPTQDGDTITIPEQKWVSYTDADGAPLAAGTVAVGDGLQVVAHPALGFVLADGAPASWQFGEHAPAQQQLEITGLRHHYHQGAHIALEAVASPAAPDASYAWFVQRKDQTEPVQVPDAHTAQLLLKAEQAYDGTLVTVRLLDAAGATLADAAPVKLDVDDHGAAPYHEVKISGLADHYHTGSVANLSASVDPASVLTRFEWQTQAHGQSTWQTVADEHTSAYSFTVTEALAGAQVRARLTFNDGSEYVVSAPVQIKVNDHHGATETKLSVSGLADSYRVGDVAKLRAVQDPQTSEDHYHWFIKRHGADDYTVVPGAYDADLSYTLLAEDDGALLVAKLYGHDHALVAESAPVTLHLAADEVPAPAKPQSAPTAQTDAALTGVDAGGITLDRKSVAQGGTVTVTVTEAAGLAEDWVAAWLFSNPALLGGDWQQVTAAGTFTVRVPADTTPGAHKLAVFDRDGAVVGWQSLEVTQASAGPVAGGGAGDRLPNTGASSLAPLVAGGVVLLLAGAAATVVARRRTGAAD